MIAGRKPPEGRDATAPRRDNRHRISKPLPSGPSGAQRPQQNNNGSSSYMTEEQLSERFIADEDNFVLQQSKKKADIRVRERRAKAIDFLAFNLRFVDEDHDVFDDEDGDELIEIPPADAMLETSSDRQLKELEEDIKSFRTLEKNKQNRAYWQAMLVLCRAAREQQQQHESGRILGSVASDIDRILSPKSLKQLEALENQIRNKLRSDEPIDTDYWEQLLRQLQVWKAKATVKKINDASREKRLQLLRERQPARPKVAEIMADQDSDEEDDDDDILLGDTAAAEQQGAGRNQEVSSSTAPPPGTARFAAVSNEDFSQATRALYEREVARGIGEGEEIFAAEEVVLMASKPKWADKYRPRKPRYFNRVQMGFEWNKYNQTHYDHDNPPPKVVQGYKFNVFYPELIDKTKTPTYHITREGGRRKGESFAPAGEEDTCLIRFSAGPPYEDIAFRIVDREWDYSAKGDRGYRSVFEKGILQLHFKFKKIYYRK